MFLIFSPKKTNVGTCSLPDHLLLTSLDDDGLGIADGRVAQVVVAQQTKERVPVPVATHTHTHTRVQLWFSGLFGGLKVNNLFTYYDNFTEKSRVSFTYSIEA